MENFENSPISFTHKISGKLIKLRKAKYYISCIIILVLTTPASYLFFSFAVEYNFFELYSRLDAPLKDYLSLQSLWIDTIISLSTPLFLSVALSIQLARLNDEDAKKIEAIIPWIPKINYLFAAKMPLFFVFTASIFFGGIGLLVFGGRTVDYTQLYISVYPLSMLALSGFMRVALTSNIKDDKFGRFIFLHHKKITITFIVIAGSAWCYSELFNPAINRWKIFEYIKHSATFI